MLTCLENSENKKKNNAHLSRCSNNALSYNQLSKGIYLAAVLRSTDPFTAKLPRVWVVSTPVLRNTALHPECSHTS